MHVSRSHLRKISIWFVLWGVVAPIVGQFSISVAQEWGWFQNPSGKVAAVLTWLATLTASTWFHWIGGAIVGFAAGVWLDAMLKRRDDAPLPVSSAEAKPALAAEVSPPTSKREPVASVALLSKMQNKYPDRII